MWISTTDRKELEEDFIEQSDDDDIIDDKLYLNLNENDGETFERPGCGQLIELVLFRGCVERRLCLSRDAGE